jgi:S-layer homology domain
VAGYPCGGDGEPCVPPGNRPYYRPGASVTRGQAAKIVAGTAAFPAPPPDDQRFEDVPPGHSFFPWVETLSWLDLVAGYPCGGPGEPCVPPLNLAYFRPGNDITRGQSAKIVGNTFLAECVAKQAP